MINRIRTLILFAYLALFSSYGFATDNQDIVSDKADTATATREFNDQIRKTSRRLRELEDGIPLSTGTTGILTTSRGGTGQDASAWTSGDLIYLSGTGTFSHASSRSLMPSYAAGNYLIMGPGYGSGPGVAGGVYEKLSEYYLPRGGTLRIKFWLTEGGGATYSKGRIYRNGVAVGTERSETTGTMTEYSEDISGWSAGDLCQLYIAADAPAANFNGGLRLYESLPIKEVDNSTVLPVTIYKGSGVPNTSLGVIGDVYMDFATGGASTTLYVKTGAATWTVK